MAKGKTANGASIKVSSNKIINLFRDQGQDIISLAFPGRKINQYLATGVFKIVDQLKHDCQIKRTYTPHTCHMFATELLEKGLDLREVQLLMGHSSINTTQIYTHLEKSKLKRTFNNCHPLS